MAGFKARKTVLLSKIETLVPGDLAYGSTAAPVVTSLDGSMAVQIVDPSLDPIIGDYKDLNHVRDWMGNSRRIQASRHSALSFKTPFSGISAPSGTTPAWGQLLRMCGFAQTTDTYWTTYRDVAAAASIGATSVVLSNVTGLKVGDQVAPNYPAGTLAASGVTISAINTTTKTVTLTGGALLANLPKGGNLRFRRSTTTATTSASAGSGATVISITGAASTHALQVGMGVSGTGIATGTYVEAVNTDSIRISKAATASISSGATLTFDYKRCYFSTVSSGHEYGTMQVYLDRLMHKLTGVRGNVKISASAGELPMFEFSMLGLYNDPTDASGAAQNPVYTAWKDPEAVNARNTYISYAGINLNVKQFELDIANEVKYRNLVNAEDVQIIDRKTTGTLSWECDAIAAQNWFNHVNAGTGSALYFRHGSTGGNYVEIHADDMALFDLKYTVEDGVYFFTASMAFTPNSGGDDIVIQAY